MLRNKRFNYFKGKILQIPIQKGFSLISALLIAVIVMATVAVLGMLIMKSQRLSSEIKIYKNTKEAAEAAAYAIITTIDNKGDIPLNCTDVNTGSPCSLGCSSSSNCICKVDWDKDPLLKKIEEAIEKSPTIENPPEGYLLTNCTKPDGTTLYTIEVVVPSKTSTKTTLYFIYEFQK